MRASICPNCRAVQSNPTGFCKACGARLIDADVEPGAQQRGPLAFVGGLWRRGGALIWAGMAVVALLLFGLIVWRGAASPAVPNPTAGPPTPAATQAGLLAATALAAAPTSAAATPTALRNATSTAAPAAIATQITPARVITGTLPITLTVAGSNLDQVQAATLNLPDGSVATAAFQPGTAEQFTLVLRALPATEGRELTLTLQLDGTAQAAAISLQNYTANKRVAGVKPDYLYTNRVNAAGPYTRMRAAPDAASAPVGMLYNGDSVDVMRDDVEGWYLLRIVDSRDPGQRGAAGWIERWLIDDTGVPPPPTPLPTVRFSARVDVNFEGSGNSGQFRSCVAGRVQTADGRLYPGALVNVNNGPKNSFPARTGRNGEYRVCGLGPSHWNVVLIQVPGMTLAQRPGGLVYLNGDAQEAIVHFFRQR